MGFVLDLVVHEDLYKNIQTSRKNAEEERNHGTMLIGLHLVLRLIITLQKNCYYTHRRQNISNPPNSVIPCPLRLICDGQITPGPQCLSAIALKTHCGKIL